MQAVFTLQDRESSQTIVLVVLILGKTALADCGDL
jgi:hypothetical protein